MQVILAKYSALPPQPVSVRCPYCDQLGSFEPLHNVNDASNGHSISGIRRCPNPSCSSAVFVVLAENNFVIGHYPVSNIAFDFANIPENIAQTFRQALATRSHGLNIASAIMIRRTLEELCHDKGAVGENLKKRLEALRANIIIPPALLAALDDLRLFGNDAAHVEASTFDKIGTEELDAAIDLVKEILKSVYQLDSLLMRLQALKKNANHSI